MSNPLKSPNSVSPGFSRYRADFPLLKRRLNGCPIVYLDSAATSLKPQAVIDEVVRFYSECTANVHRAVHLLSEEATEAFEDARKTIAQFIGADDREIVFVRHATEALNLIASSFPKDAVVAVSEAEHHSNILPWRHHNHVVSLPLNKSGHIDLDQAADLLRLHRPAVVALSTVGNAFGIRQPVTQIAELARDVGARVVLDASQSVGHEPVDVEDLECDYLCFSGHKMLAPGGVGVLYVRSGSETSLQPLQHGGSMVLSVDQAGCELQPYPWRLEPGSPNVEGVLGLAAACDYIDSVGLDSIQAHTQSLCRALRAGLADIPRANAFGGNEDQLEPETAITCFGIVGLEAHGVARILSNRYGIMVRSGFHCAQPLHQAQGVPESVRVSVHLYNTIEEIDCCLEALDTIARVP